jgi:hypothetical protein
MAVVAFTGFEHGDTSELNATAGGTTVQSTTKRTGGYGLKILSATANAATYGELTGYAADGTFAVYSVATVYHRFYFQYATKAGSGSEIIAASLDSGNTVKGAIALTSTGVLTYRNAAGVLATGSTTLTANTWYRIEFRCGTGASANYELKIDGTSEVSGTGDLGTNNNAKLRIGKAVNTDGWAIEYYFDDVYLDDAAYPGIGECKVMLPNGEGSTAQWTVGAGGAGTGDYTDVDEIPTNTDTDYIQKSSAASQTHLVAFESSSSAGISGTINAVKFMARIRESSNSTSASGVRIRSGSTNSDSSTRNGSTSYVWQGRCLGTDPADSSAWTTSDLDGIEAGVIDTASITTVRCTTMILSVDYVPSTGNVYNDTLTESVTGAESQAVVATVAPTCSESVAGAESNAAAATFVTTLSEPVTAAESTSGGLLLSSTVTEPLTGAESLAAVVTAVTTLSEPVTGAENLAASATFVPTSSDSVTGAESMVPALTMPVIISEAGTVAESLSVSATLVLTISEPVTGAESLAATATFIPTFSESVAGAESLAVVATLAPTLSESGTAAESLSAGLLITSTFSESGTAAENLSAAVTFNATGTETVTVIESVANATTFVATFSDAVTSGDQFTSGLIFIDPISYTLTGADTLAVAANCVVTNSESTTATESVIPAFTTSGAVTEIVASGESIAAALTASATVSGAVSGAETLAAVATFAAPLTESVTAADDVTDGGAQVYNVSYSDSASVGDALAVALTAVPALSEGATIAESLSAAMTASAPLSETLTIAAAQTAANSMSSTCSESASAGESIACQSHMVLAVLEAGTVAGAFTALATLVASIADDQIASDEQPSVSATFEGLLDELLTGADDYASFVGIPLSSSSLDWAPLGGNFLHWAPLPLWLHYQTRNRLEYAPRGGSPLLFKAGHRLHWTPRGNG